VQDFGQQLKVLSIRRFHYGSQTYLLPVVSVAGGMGPGSC
jgi:hypothetical protein